MHVRRSQQLAVLVCVAYACAGLFATTADATNATAFTQFQGAALPAANLSDIILNGVVTDAWNNNTQEFGPDDSVFSAYFYLTPGDTLIAEFGVSVTMAPEHGLLEVDLDPNAGNVTSSISKPDDFVNFELSFNCIGDGSVFVQVSVDTGAQYEPMLIRFVKHCDFQPNRVAKTFEVSHNNNGQADVVRNGVETNLIPYVAPPETTEETFYVWLNDTGNASSVFTVDSVQTDFGLMLPKYNCLGGCTAKPWSEDHADEVAKFTVTYNCIPGEDDTHSLTATFSIPEKDPITFSWDKHCNTPLSKGGGGHGMSAAGVFFLTVFIISLVFFIAAAVFKYVKMGKRGVEVIPCIDTCRECGEKLFNKPMYTPQEDYSAPLGTGNSGYGAADYQTNL